MQTKETSKHESSTGAARYAETIGLCQATRGCPKRSEDDEIQQLFPESQDIVEITVTPEEKRYVVSQALEYTRDFKTICLDCQQKFDTLDDLFKHYVGEEKTRVIKPGKKNLLRIRSMNTKRAASTTSSYPIMDAEGKLMNKEVEKEDLDLYSADGRNRLGTVVSPKKEGEPSITKQVTTMQNVEPVRSKQKAAEPTTMEQNMAKSGTPTKQQEDLCPDNLAISSQ